MKHTKGTWTVDRSTDNARYQVRAGENGLVLVQHTFDGEEAKANVKLMAAAPMLLENLARLIDRIEEAGLKEAFPSAYKRALEAVDLAISPL